MYGFYSFGALPVLGASGCDIYGQDIGTVLMSILISRKQAPWEPINSNDEVRGFVYFLVKIRADIFCAVASFLETSSLISFIGVSNKRVIVQISLPVASFNRIKACINLEAGANRIRRPSKWRSIRNESARARFHAASRGESIARVGACSHSRHLRHSAFLALVNSCYLPTFLC